MRQAASRRTQFEGLRQSCVVPLLAVLWAGCAHVEPPGKPPRPFSFERDTPAFSNETVWTYRDGIPVTTRESKHNDPHGEPFTHRCFAMTRATLLFWKFARFEPDAPPLEDEALTLRIHAVLKHHSWAPALPPEKRIVIPGYANLRDFSAGESLAFRRNLSGFWRTYFRPGNMLLAFPMAPPVRDSIHDKLRGSLEQGHPMALWLYNFPNLNMNHAVLAYAIAPSKGNTLRYWTYDPNQAGKPAVLDYNPHTHQFSFPPAFYYRGGPVKIRPAYVSWFQ